MVKSQQWSELQYFYRSKTDEMIEYFLKTEGCYLISTESGIALAYRTFKQNHTQVYEDGLDLFVQFATGDLTDIISFCGDNIENILFDRRGVLKTYNLEELKSKIMNITP
jgi:hypothetical protein